MSAVEQRAVAADEADIRLDRWFKRHFPALGHGRLQKLLRTGQVRIDGRRAQASARLAAGQTIRIPPLADSDEPKSTPSASRPSRQDADELRAMILHEDDALIAFDKPPGLAVQGGSRTTHHIDGMLASLAPKGERYRLVHRLDRDTGGLLVVAKTASSAAKLARAFQRHDVQKLYWALVAGLPPLEHGIIDNPLAKAPSRGGPDFELVQAGVDGAQKAVTRYRTIARAGKIAAWLALQPLSGRTHQLRVHCALIDCPILGDPKYGGPKARPDGAPDALMLHARELELPHPDGGRLTLTAPLSDTMRSGFAWIGFEPDAHLPGARLLDFEEL
ncbi:MAG: RluA family pseudouridine synthase [Rhizobiales bacterium]|nr:RluA family pseudouridine synthase [Hyphomicrobiales bacterium]